MNELKWTTEKPTKEGWYWHVSVIGTDMTLLSIAQVIDCDGLIIAYIGDNGGVDVCMISGSWAGPLTAPSFNDI